MNSPTTVAEPERFRVDAWRYRNRARINIGRMPADDLEHRPGVCESCDYYRLLREQR